MADNFPSHCVLCGKEIPIGIVKYTAYYLAHTDISTKKRFTRHKNPVVFCNSICMNKNTNHAVAMGNLFFNYPSYSLKWGLSSEPLR